MVKFAIKDIPGLTGKTALVTGGGNGIGFHTCLQLARHGARVLFTARSETRAAEATAALEAALAAEAKQGDAGGGSFEALVMDNADLRTVRVLAQSLLERKDLVNIDIVILNAGIFCPPFELIDGIESQYMVNHMSHYLLGRLLFPRLLKQAQGGVPVRFVLVSSEAGELYPDKDVDYAGLLDSDPSKYSRMESYQRSKNGNILFGMALNKRVPADVPLYVNFLHPGRVSTNISTSMKLNGFLTALAKTMMGLLMMTASDGALATLFLATSPRVTAENIRARFFYPYGVEHPLPSKKWNSEAAAEESWTWCEGQVKRILGDGVL